MLKIPLSDQILETNDFCPPKVKICEWKHWFDVGRKNFWRFLGQIRVFGLWENERKGDRNGFRFLQKKKNRIFEVFDPIKVFRNDLWIIWDQNFEIFMRVLKKMWEGRREKKIRFSMKERKIERSI